RARRSRGHGVGWRRGRRPRDPGPGAGNPAGLLSRHVLRRLPASRGAAVGAGAALGPAAARRAAVHHPAPDQRAVAEADGARAALGTVAARERRARALAQADGPDQAQQARAPRPVYGSRDSDAQPLLYNTPVP